MADPIRCFRLEDEGVREVRPSRDPPATLTRAGARDRKDAHEEARARVRVGGPDTIVAVREVADGETEWLAVPASNWSTFAEVGWEPVVTYHAGGAQWR